MSANVFTFPARSKGPQPWTNDELAELYRVVDLLGKAGLAVMTDMGMSDEGDPWFVFCRADNEEVIAHFARIDGHFVAASIAVDETFRGANFRQIVDRMVSSQPLVVPKPGTGSRLFMHPAVLLTAFVATALAHSEKMLAQEFMRAVEAQWDHSKAAALNEVKHIKTSWLDTLNSLGKLVQHDGKLAHDAIKETQALTLASLIAIAMAALQPITEKIAILSQIIADEFPGHNGSAAQGQSAHAAQMAQEAVQGADLAAQVNDHRDSHAQSGADPTHSHKAASASADGGADGQKTMIDGSHGLTVPVVQKAVAETAIHAPAHAAEVAAADINSAFQLLQQKVTMVAAAQTQAPEPFAIHLDAANTPTQAITLQDLTAEAQQILFHGPGSSGKPDASSPAASTPPEDTAPQTPASAASPTPTPTPASADANLTQPSVPSSVASAPTPSPVQPYVGTQEVNIARDGSEAAIDAISNFLTSGTHNISNPSAMNFSASLQQELSGYFGGSSTLKIVVFDTTAAVADIIPVAPGVVFVADKDFTPNAILSNHGGNLILDLSGGTITLVGVVTIEHAVV